MKQNKYDDPIFFEKYSQMSRSQQGLEGAGERETLQSSFSPRFHWKTCPGPRLRLRLALHLCHGARRRIRATGVDPL